jgi:uroporphyrinogen decarboxylase
MYVSLSAKERVVAQIQHQETDPIPYTLGLEGDVPERLDAYYGSNAWRSLIENAIHQITGPQLVVGETSERYYTDPYGSRWDVQGRPFHLVEPVLTTPSLSEFVFPDLDALLDQAWRNETLQAVQQHQDGFTAAGFGFGLFERTWGLRGFEHALMDAALRPDFYQELVEQVADHQIAIVDRLLGLPVDGIMFSDDWGYQRGVLLGPERWRRFLKPRLARMYARVHEAGKYVITHCCGSIEAILPDLIEIGLDVYQSVQPEAADSNPYELKLKYGEQITFWGGLGSQSTIPFGTPQKIRAEIARLCREMGQGGGYILAPAKALQPGTPTENAAAVVEAFLQQAGLAFP